MTLGHYSFLLLPHSLSVRGARSCQLLLCRTSQQSIPVLIISSLITVSQLDTSWSLRHENSLSSGLALYCHSHNKWLGTQHKLNRCQILRHSWYLWKTNPPTTALITALPWAQNTSALPTPNIQRFYNTNLTCQERIICCYFHLLIIYIF